MADKPKMSGDIELNEMVKNGELVEAESRFEGGTDAAPAGDGKKWQDCGCVCCDTLIGIVCLGMFLSKLTSNPGGYAAVFAASGGLLFSFLYLCIIRIIWAIIGCCWFCCPGCADMCRCPCRVVLGLLTFILMCVCLSEALYPEKLMAKMGGGLVGNLFGSISGIGSLIGNSLTNAANAFNSAGGASGGLSGLNAAFGGLSGSNRRRLFLESLLGALNPMKPATEFAELAKGLGITTLVLYFLIPACCNGMFLLGICCSANATVDWFNKPENVGYKVGMNNVPFLLALAGCINRDAIDLMRTGGGAENEGGEKDSVVHN